MLQNQTMRPFEEINAETKHLMPHAVIVEDEEALSVAFQMALTQAGYYVQVIRDGRQALKHLKNISPRLLLLDLNLPGVSGADILASIKELPAYKDTHIFLVTANTRLAQELEGSVDLVLEKPIGIKVLQRLAERYKPMRQFKEQPIEPIDIPNYPNIAPNYG
ncbi:MAG: PleD family two-component system response regulator [Anaerolineae bacterium]